MADPTPRFFETLAHGKHVPSLESTSGTVRFDLRSDAGVAHWYIRITKGDVELCQSNDEADCVVGGDAAVLAAVARGEMNAMAAVLRGAIQIQGKAILIGQLQRLFPGPACDDRGQPVAADAEEAK